jgi:HlyD family secretion protein
LTLSREAVYQNSGKRYVFTIQDGHLKRAEVQTGIANLTRIQVIQGLNEGTSVALGATNAQALYDGAPVKIIE